jgi:tetratricopeptide (TPR) repeat protein
LLSEVFPCGKPGNWEIYEALSSHAQAVLEYRYTSKSSLLHRATLLYNVARYELEHRQYEAAYRSCMEADDAHQSLLGESNYKILNSLRLLASVLDRRDKYEAAEEVDQRVLELREIVLGKEHTREHEQPGITAKEEGPVRSGQGDVPTSARIEGEGTGEGASSCTHKHGQPSNGAGQAGNYKAAKEILQRVLELSRKILGKKNPNTLTTIGNLAFVLSRQGKHEAAEKMCRRELELSEKALGKKHPSTLMSMDNLALVLKCQNKQEAAEEIKK